MKKKLFSVHNHQALHSVTEAMKASLANRKLACQKDVPGDSHICLKAGPLQ